MEQSVKSYDLGERTEKFGENIIEFCKSVNQDVISKLIISQIVRSGTSIGANYMEANNASSRKDFRNKIFICKKEAQETKHWLRMMAGYISEKTEGIEKLQRECQQLIMIFQKIISTLEKNNKIEAAKSGK